MPAAGHHTDGGALAMRWSPSRPRAAMTSRFARHCVRGHPLLPDQSGPARDFTRASGQFAKTDPIVHRWRSALLIFFRRAFPAHLVMSDMWSRGHDAMTCRRRGSLRAPLAVISSATLFVDLAQHKRAETASAGSKRSSIALSLPATPVA
jgi:hypothetical protein